MSEQQARDTTTSAWRLEELRVDPALRLVVASNPAAPAQVLEILATDPNVQVRAAVASNPNTPWTLLKELAPVFPHAFLQNPAGSLQLLAHPEQNMTEGGFWENRFWGSVLREASVPLLWWNWLRSHPTLHISEEVCLHILSAGELASLAEIAQEQDEHTLLVLMELLTVASSQGAFLPPFTSTLRERASVITHGRLIMECFVRLARSGDQGRRQVVAAHPQVPEEVMQTLAGDPDVSVRMSLAGNPQTPPAILQALALDQDKRVRSWVAWNKQTPLKVLRDLARDPDRYVRAAVARHERMPAEVFHLLAHDHEEDGVVQEAANHVQSQLARVPFGEVECEKECEKRHPQDMWIKQQVKHVLKHMASQGVSSDLRQSTLAALAADWDETSISHAFWDLGGLNNLDSISSRRRSDYQCVMDPFMPPIALQKLAASPCWDIRILVAFHPRTPREVRQRLGIDGNRYVRAIAQAIGMRMTAEGTD